MARTTHIALLSLLYTTTALGSQERILSPSRVALTADAGQPFGVVSAEVQVNPNGTALASVKLQVGNRWESVPAKGLAGLTFMMVNKLELRTERGWDSDPWLYVYLEITVATSPKTWVTKKVHFGYHRRRFEARSVSTPVKAGQDKWEQLKL